MAITTRLAAKLAVLSTLTTTGGVGTYYYTTGHDLPFQTQTASEVPVETKEAAGNLDAVASAWSEAKPARVAESRGANLAETSPTARSAEVTLAHAELPVKPTVSGDRYSITTAPTASPIDELAPKTVAEPTPAEVPEKSPASEPTEETSVPLARGQAPDEKQGVVTDSNPIETVTDSDQASDTATGTQDAATPQQLKALDQDAKLNPSLNDTARRAKEAFRDQSSVPPAAATPVDRYGTMPPRSIEPLNGTTDTAAAAKNNAGSNDVNPFASRPAPPAANSLSTAAPRDIQPLESAQPLPPAASGLADREPLGGSYREQPMAAAPHTDTAAAQPIGEYDAETRGDKLNMPPNPRGGLTNANAETLGTIDGTGKPGEHALEGPQKPALVIQKFAPGEIQVGKPAKFVVQVRNVGGQTAQEVAIRDEVPQGTKLVNTTPKADINASQLTWQIGSLSAGEERTVEMQLMPTAEGEIGSVATVSYAAQASAKTRCTMPQLAIRMTAPNEVMIGQQQRVKIELRNPGSGDATGVMLFENVPQNVKHAAGPALEFEIGTLRAGETRELELVLLAEKAGKVTNVLSARAEGNLQVQQQVEFEVIAPGLAVGVNGPERRYLERPATYEVSIENPGTASARDIQLITKLPKGLKFVRANNMGEYDAATHTVYWSLAELPKGERGTVELVAMPVETGPQTLEVEGHAKQGLSDQAKQNIVVEGLAAIMFEVRDLEDPIEVGRETGYEIRVVNQGTKAATNVQVTVNLPAGLQLVSAEGEANHAAQGGSIVFEPIPQLAPKADTLLRVKAQGVQAGDQRVTVEVKTDDLDQPIRKEESTRIFGDQ